MPRVPLAWLPLLRHWTHCLGEGPDAIARMVDLAALLPGGPGWSDVHNNWAITLNALRSLMVTANDTRLCSALCHRHKAWWC